MMLSRNERSLGSMAMAALFGTMLTPASAIGGLNDAGLATLAQLAFNAPSAVAARAVRAAYYSVRYDNENGPYPTYDEAIKASQVTLWNAVHVWMQGESDLEQGLLIYRDKYNQYWFLTPRQSLDLQITLDTAAVKRPGSTIVAMSHSHPAPKPGYMENFPQGQAGDNLTAYDQFVQRFGGDIWYYRPSTHAPKLYGVMKDGVLSTKYTGFDANGQPNTNKLPMNIDLYELDKQNGGDGSKIWWDKFTEGTILHRIIFAVVAVNVIVLVTAFGGGSGSSTEGLPTPGVDDLSGGW